MNRYAFFIALWFASLITNSVSVNTGHKGEYIPCRRWEPISALFGQKLEEMRPLLRDTVWEKITEKGTQTEPFKHAVGDRAASFTWCTERGRGAVVKNTGSNDLVYALRHHTSQKFVIGARLQAGDYQHVEFPEECTKDEVYLHIRKP
ncbi:uncharacterized protein PGTG_11701 [Puccinia graminis f. sp. tritici CRL 75-36-700-3]|uniref:Uncharacterized protein n=2 Tax=Puccinia graminis f. sp. tritici TaxID=56615 RepID=E3KNS0_PUCGT|nr:uncharacterized protein PGTG_11701 [Puccinia graminis f. sp. tritici CRL 75-36-700-3]EFP85945.2 hypothetical protein PGTG_11701 [Puccinia graminis f. sp. tritici CRL 75-36-700-3]